MNLLFSIRPDYYGCGLNRAEDLKATKNYLQSLETSITNYFSRITQIYVLLNASEKQITQSIGVPYHAISPF